jgi:hypothetical protein
VNEALPVPPASPDADAVALRLLAADVVRHDVDLGRLAAFLLARIDATLTGPPAAAPAVVGSLLRLFSDMPAAALAAFLRDEATWMDAGGGG